MRGRQFSAANNEHMRCICFSDKAANVEHQRVVGAGLVRLDFRQN
jgi:hypothetical protein